LSTLRSAKDGASESARRPVVRTGRSNRSHIDFASFASEKAVSSQTNVKPSPSNRRPDSQQFLYKPSLRTKAEVALMTSSEELRYDRTTIALHWFTAALVASLWIIGQTSDWLPRGALRNTYWSAHVALGFALAAVVAWRIVWRGASGRRLPAAGSGVLRLAAETAHGALYVLLVIVIALGVVNAFVRGYNLFDLVHLPQIGDASLRRPITHWHGLAANILLGLALLHALAALSHHYVLKDAVLRRMAP
jgi:cytochrome b561